MPLPERFRNNPALRRFFQTVEPVSTGVPVASYVTTTALSADAKNPPVVDLTVTDQSQYSEKNDSGDSSVVAAKENNVGGAVIEKTPDSMPNYHSMSYGELRKLLPAGVEKSLPDNKKVTIVKWLEKEWRKTHQ